MSVKCLWFIDGSSRNEGGVFGALASFARQAPASPVISGDPYQGQELTSTANGEWLINGVPTGVVGDTFTVPDYALLGDEITQAGSNVLTVIRVPDSIGIRIDTEQPGSASNTMIIPAWNAGSYAARIYWGDGAWDDVTTYNAAELTHTYPEPGQYDIQISGTFRGLNFNNGGDRQKLLRIDQWGDTGQAPNQNLAFYGCVNLTTLPDDMTLANLTGGQAMFFNTSITTLPPDMTLPNLGNGIAMFYNTSITTLPDGMTLPNLASGASMFDGASITTARYSQLLIDLSAHNPNNNVVFHGGNSKYNEAGAIARAALIGRGWTITDGGPE